MHNITKDAIIPPQRNGPNGKISFPFALFHIIRNPAYNPPARAPNTMAIILPSKPRKRPPAAISLISPPPKPPGSTRTISIIHPLIMNIPRSLCAIAGPGTVTIEQIPTASIAALYLLGIRIVFRSTQAMAKSNPKNKRIVIQPKIASYVTSLKNTENKK